MTYSYAQPSITSYDSLNFSYKHVGSCFRLSLFISLPTIHLDGFSNKHLKLLLSFFKLLPSAELNSKVGDLNGLGRKYLRDHVRLNGLLLLSSTEDEKEP